MAGEPGSPSDRADPTQGRPGLALGAAEDVNQFGDLAALDVAIAVDDGFLDAVGDMVAQHLLLDPAQGGPNSGELRDDVDAVPVLLDHARDSANLALDAAEAFPAGCLGVILHA